MWGRGESIFLGIGDLQVFFGVFFCGWGGGGGEGGSLSKLTIFFFFFFVLFCFGSIKILGSFGGYCKNRD